MISVAILGYGVVGSGVAEVLRKNSKGIARKAGDTLEVRRLLDLRDFPQSPLADRFTKRFEDIVEDEEIRIVVETMGGLHPAYDYVKACLLAGKSVVTSNKELVAEKGDELLRIANEQGVCFLFEASVGGGIPILHPLDECLAANEVYEIAGILNGTTNFMLTRMAESDMDFGEALALAQQLGYAERDPSADVDGADACRKICILASLAFGKHVYPHQVNAEGIRALTPEDLAAAEAAGGVIKLIGRAQKTADGHLHALVAPMLVPNASPLAGVSDVYNGILVRGDAIGDVMFYGRGAGSLPTASAVAADIIDACRHQSGKRVMWDAGCEDYVLSGAPNGQVLLRLQCDDREAAAAEAAAVFGVACLEAQLPDDQLCLLTNALSDEELTQRAASLKHSRVIRQIRAMEA